jgi:hypothetical protein
MMAPPRVWSTGLGLAVPQLVELMGALSMISQLGKGSVSFTLALDTNRTRRPSR